MYIVERKRAAVARDLLARYAFKNSAQTCRNRLKSISANGDPSILKDKQEYGVVIERTEYPCKSYGLYDPYTVLGILPCQVDREKHEILTGNKENQNTSTITDEMILVEI